MSKNLLEAAERIVGELSAREQLTLAKELMRRTRKERWNRLFTTIDTRVKRYGTPSEAEIIRMCREVRREYARSHRHP